MTYIRMYVKLLMKLALSLRFDIGNETFSKVQNLCELLYLFFYHKNLFLMFTLFIIENIFLNVFVALSFFRFFSNLFYFIE